MATKVLIQLVHFSSGKVEYIGPFASMGKADTFYNDFDLHRLRCNHVIVLNFKPYAPFVRLNPYAKFIVPEYWHYTKGGVSK